MKTIKIFAIATLAVLALSCGKDEDEYTSTGTITGADDRTCFCCGGYHITVDGSGQYRFFGLPLENDINLATDTIYPIQVELDWSLAANGCNGEEILIQRIRKVAQ